MTLVAGQSNQRPQVILLGRSEDRPQFTDAVNQLKPTIKKHCDVVYENFSGDSYQPTGQADMAIVFGGDGSILRAARMLATQPIPVLGVNFGKLGFLADIQPQQLETALQFSIRGEFKIVEHILLACEVWHGDRLLVSDVGVNEVAILGGPPYQIQQIDLYVDGQLAASYHCDGLILSTPVGSTAHNLSAGGPIVRRDLSAVVISAINPHTLTVRPVVDLAERKYELVARKSNSSTSVVIDGRTLLSLTAEHRVSVTKSDSKFTMIEVAGHDYYKTLREKLGWGIPFQENQSKIQ